MRYITLPIFLSLLHLGLAAAQVDDAWPAYGGEAVFACSVEEHRGRQTSNVEYPISNVRCNWRPAHLA